MKKLFPFYLLVFLIVSCSPKTPVESSEFPLNKGTTWTYSYEAYEPSPTDSAQVIEATYQLIETVIDTETVAPYFIAHVKREYQLADVDPVWTGDFEVSQPNEYWYVVDNNKIFESRSPIETNTTKIDGFLLDYVFPLSLSSAWCRQSSNLKAPTSNNAAACEFIGKRIVTNSGTYETSAGKFDDCYELTDYLNGGNIIHWFCTGIGIVYRRFDHAGTRFGFEETLTDYSIP